MFPVISMSADPVLQELSDGVLRLTLNRPDKRNAMDTGMIDGLHQGLERADLDAAVRVLVVQGAGKDFCAGADLAELLASADQSSAENETHAMHRDSPTASNTVSVRRRLIDLLASKAMLIPHHSTRVERAAANAS